jgi:hypothetical protein
VVAVNLTDGGVEVHRHGLGAGSGARCPGPGERVFGDPVELADMAEGERAQERPQRTGRHHPVAEHGCGGPGAQHVGVVDAVAAGHQRMHQGQQLAAGPVCTGPLTKVDQLVDHLLDAQAVGQRSWQQQPGVGDRVVVIEGHAEGVGAVGGWHRESAS